MKWLFTLLLIVFNFSTVFAQDTWLDATDCQVQQISHSYYFDGNIGNFNLANIEAVSVILSGCSGDTTVSWLTFKLAHPEDGTVKGGGHKVPATVFKEWLNVLQIAKTQKRKVSVSGQSSVLQGIEAPVTIVLH